MWEVKHEHAEKQLSIVGMVGMQKYSSSFQQNSDLPELMSGLLVGKISSE